jgi:hypothetical protein
MDESVRVGFICLRIGFIGMLLWTLLWNFGLDKWGGYSWTAEQLVVFHAGLYALEIDCCYITFLISLLSEKKFDCRQGKKLFSSPKCSRLWPLAQFAPTASFGLLHLLILATILLRHTHVAHCSLWNLVFLTHTVSWHTPPLFLCHHLTPTHTCGTL